MDSNKNGLILPKFDANGHDYVEIAGIKWATMNVGANKVTDYGLYFQWGDTQGYTADQVGKKEDGKKTFAGNWRDYKFAIDGGSSFTKYNGKDGKTELELDDDAVHAAWGGSWRMPTVDEFITLRDAATIEWTDNYKEKGVAGIIVTDRTDNLKTLFFPACGYAIGGSVYNVGGIGRYWYGSLYSYYLNSACNLYFYDGYVNWLNGSYLLCGFVVRGVLA